MGILIKSGRVVDAAAGLDRVTDLYLDDGKVIEAGDHLSCREQNDLVIDAAGRLVMPGIVDMHVHLRDPGQTEKEDIESGSRAAARGGVTTLVAMPNTSPVIDSADRMNYVRNKASEVSPIHIIQAGALSKGEQGQELAELENMIASGASVFSEDGKSIPGSRLMREAMKITARHQALILDHCEDLELRGDGCMNEDENSARLSLPGICNAVEDVIAGRDILLAMDTGARLHLCHCSTKGTARMMELVRELGIQGISAEVCPHHLLLTSDDIPRDDPNYKMNPPLRTREDRDALLKALKDGSISVISTDHAPHTAADKTGSMRTAAFGITGLETSLPLIYTCLVEQGHLSILEMVERMCWNPARLLSVQAGTLMPGYPADVIIVDTDTTYTIRKEDLVSKGKNTPFDGWEVRGRVLYTICGGKVIYEYK